MEANISSTTSPGGAAQRAQRPDSADAAALIDQALERLGDDALADVARKLVDRLGDAALLDSADRVIGRLAGMPLSGAIEDAALAGSVARLGRLERRVAAEKLRRVGEADRRRAYRASGHGSSEELLSAGRTLTRGEAKAQTQAARALAQLPRTAKRLAAGELSVGQAQLATRALDELPSELDASDRADAVDELDELVAGKAGREDRRQLADTVRRWQHAIDERLVKDRERRAWERREAKAFAERDGSTVWRLRLDPVGAAKVRAMVEPLARRDGPEDRRSRGQRLADAFTAAAERLLDAGGLPETAMQRPHVIVIARRDALDGVPGADPSTLDGFGLISSVAARMIACDGEVTEVVVDERERPLVVREPSKVTRRQRAAVIARDRGCIGCWAPVVRCQLHHIRWRRHRGATVVENLVLVCWDCHRKIHYDGWQVIRRGGRYGLAEPDAAANAPPRAERRSSASPSGPASPGGRDDGRGRSRSDAVQAGFFEPPANADGSPEPAANADGGPEPAAWQADAAHVARSPDEFERRTA